MIPRQPIAYAICIMEKLYDIFQFTADGRERERANTFQKSAERN